MDGLVPRGTEWVIPPPILKDGHHPSIRPSLDSVARNIEEPGSVLHLDEKLGSVKFYTMLPPVQGTTIENRVPGVLVQDASPHEVMVSSYDPCPTSPGRWDSSGLSECQAQREG